MRELLKQGVRSVILTSGTLSPLPSLAAELQTYVLSGNVACVRCSAVGAPPLTHSPSVQSCS